jgi:hypothetical protein
MKNINQQQLHHKRSVEANSKLEFSLKETDYSNNSQYDNACGE